MDLLSDILQTVKLRGTVYFHAHFQSPWGMDIPKGQYANFHIVTNGSCWVSIKESKQQLLQLNQGDILLFPRGHSHALLDSPDSDPISADKLLSNQRKNSSNEIVFGGEGSSSCSLICGHFEHDKEISHPIFETLPSWIHISMDPEKEHDSGWYLTATQLAAKISSDNSSGTRAVIDKLAESLLLQILIDYIKLCQNQQSFLAALQHKGIAKALNAIHHDISHDWSLSELAEISSMSRTILSKKFHQLVGEPPIIYLARWRMIKARELLGKKMPLKVISENVGYKSEYSFSKAFKKLTGVSPGSYRKSLIN